MTKKTSLPWYILVILILTAGISAATAHWTEGERGVTFWTSAAISLPFWFWLLWDGNGPGKAKPWLS